MPFFFHRVPGAERTGTAVCDRCGARSQPYPCPASEAPELATSQAAERDGWHTSGWWVGNKVLCPECRLKRENNL